MDYTKKLCLQYCYFLQCDIRKFFPSVDHKVLKQKLTNKFKDKDLLWLLFTILDCAPADFPEGKGIPIGNFTSQYFANLYLDGLDHFIKETLRIPGYVRYMDDFVLFSSHKQHLRDALTEVQSFLASIQLQLSKFLLAPIQEGLPFLGYSFYPGLTKIRHHKWKNFSKKFQASQKKLLQGKISEEFFVNSMRGLVNGVSYGNTKNLRNQFFDQHFLDF
jgi:hypothetical protein